MHPFWFPLEEIAAVSLTLRGLWVERVFDSEGSPEGEKLLPELFPARRWRELGSACGLTNRQREVARLICRGMTNAEIARALGRSEAVVRQHSDGLYKKLGVGNRVGVVVKIVLADRRTDP